MIRVSTHEAKKQLSRLLSQVIEGEEVQILHGDTPIATLRRIEPSATPARRRPHVGETTSEPVQWSSQSFAPLDDAELAQW